MPFSAQLGTANSRPGNLKLGGSSGPATYNETISDSLTFTEVWQGVVISVFDTMSFTDQMSVQTVLNVSSSESLVFTDAAYNIKLGSASDTVTFSDTFNRVKNILAGIADTLVFSDTPTPKIVANRTISEALSLAESIARSVIRTINWSDTVVFTDTAVGVAPKRALDTLSFAETITEFVSKSLKDVLDFGDTIGISANVRKITGDVLELYDAISLALYLRRSLTDSLSFADASTGVTIKPVTDLISFADAVSSTLSKRISDTVSFTDVASYNRAYGVQASDLLAFAEDLRGSLVTHLGSSDVIAFADSMRALRARFFSASDSFAFTEALYREIREALAPDVLVFTDIAAAQKRAARAIQDTLVFSDAASYASLLHGSWSDAISLQDRLYAVVADEFMIFVGQQLSVVVPPPEWNDYEGDRAQVIFKRKMGGSVSTYIKTTRDQKIHYEFVIPRPKALELRAFLDAENGRQFTIYDWKGQVWLARLSTDTVERAEIGRWEPCGNKTRVALEFIGARYA